MILKYMIVEAKTNFCHFSSNSVWIVNQVFKSYESYEGKFKIAIKYC